MMGASAMLATIAYRLAFWGQLAFYLAGLAALLRRLGSGLRIALAATSFLVLNAAAWLGFWVWITGNSRKAWGKAAYAPGAESRLPSSA